MYGHYHIQARLRPLNQNNPEASSSSTLFWTFITCDFYILFIYVESAANTKSAIIKVIYKSMALSSVPNELRRMFDSLDENGDESLSLQEINCFLNKLGIHLTEEDLKCMLMGVSHRQDGSLTFDEFVRLYQSVLDESRVSTSTGSNEECQDLSLMEAFKVYDLNEDGYISSSELHQVLCNLGLIEQGGHHLEDCQRMICRYDENSDGFIDFPEFKKMMVVNPKGVHL